MTDKRFRYSSTSQIITDDLTGYTYYGNKQVCDLLNKESDRADRNVEMFDGWFKVLRKYHIDNPEKLDKVLWNSRTW